MNRFFIFLSLFFSFSLFATTEATQSPNLVILTDSNTLSLNTYYSEDSVAPIIQRALELDKNLPTNEPIYLVINSGGGSIRAGMQLIQVLAALNRPVHTISMFSASMGFETVQGLGDRLILESGTLMSHRASGLFYGEFPSGNLENRYKYWAKRIFRKDRLTVERNPNLKSLRHYHKVIANEYWCEGRQCVRHGFADKVVSSRCDSTLQGTKTEWIKHMINGYPVMIELIFSKCPLQPYVLEWQIYFQGMPLWEKPIQKNDFNFNNFQSLFPSHDVAISIVKEAKKVIDNFQSKEHKLTID